MRVNVRYARGNGTATDIPQDLSKPSGGGADGSHQVVPSGAVCDELKSDRAARIDIVLGCTNVVK